MHYQWVSGQCRICAVRDTNLINIFSHEGVHYDLQCKLYSCLKIIVTPQDILPTTLCQICISRIDAFLKLVEDCWKGQTYFSAMQYPHEMSNTETMDFKQSPGRNSQVLCNSTTAKELTQIRTSHEVNCCCRKCEIKRYGALPIVVEMIEEGKQLTSESNDSNDSKGVIISDKSTNKIEEINSESDMPLDLQVKPLITSSEVNSSEYKKSKVFECIDCNKLFKHRGDFNKHIRKHTGEQPFECPHCQRRFAHTSNLTRHLRVHTGLKPFKCEKCNRLFSRKDKLACHRKCKNVNLQEL